MLDQTFGQVYTKFKLHFYKQIFSRFEDREATLTTVESFCMEVIMALGGTHDCAVQPHDESFHPQRSL